MMNSKGPSRRRSIWPMVIVGSFVLLVVVGLTVIALRDLPAPADPRIVEESFAEHIAFLKELAMTCPEAADLPSIDPDDGFDEEAWKEYDALWNGWKKKSLSRPDLLSHRAIKGASTYVANEGGGFKVHMTVVDHEDLDPSWLESAWRSVSDDAAEASPDRPLVRQWHEDGMHLVRYETRFVGPDGETMGLQLLVDLNCVEPAETLDG